MQGIVHPFVVCHCKSLRIPFPRVDDIFGVLEGAKHFSSSDLLSGYWQTKIKVSESHEILPSPITHVFYWLGSCACQPKKITKSLDPQVGKEFLDQTEAKSQSWKTDFLERGS